MRIAKPERRSRQHIKEIEETKDTIGKRFCIGFLLFIVLAIAVLTILSALN